MIHFRVYIRKGGCCLRRARQAPGCFGTSILSSLPFSPSNYCGIWVCFMKNIFSRICVFTFELLWNMGVHFEFKYKYAYVYSLPFSPWNYCGIWVCFTNSICIYIRICFFTFELLWHMGVLFEFKYKYKYVYLCMYMHPYKYAYMHIYICKYTYMYMHPFIISIFEFKMHTHISQQNINILICICIRFSTFESFWNMGVHCKFNKEIYMCIHFHLGIIVEYGYAL